jgi:hypothetical protein
MGTLSKNFDRFGREIGSLRSTVVEKAASLNRHEGTVTSRMENLTSALPSSTWLVLAGGSLVGAIVLKAFRKNHTALFISGLAPTFLMIGLYNKLVKLHGSDRFSS